MSEATFPQLAVTGPECTELVDSPRTPLGPTQVSGPTLVTLVSPGTELAYAYTAKQGFPIHPGYAAVFRVEEVGPQVTTLTPGEVALCMGPHAAWQQVEASAALPLPAGLAPEHAVCARLMGVSMSTLTTTAAPCAGWPKVASWWRGCTPDMPPPRRRRSIRRSWPVRRTGCWRCLTGEDIFSPAVRRRQPTQGATTVAINSSR